MKLNKLILIPILSSVFVFNACDTTTTGKYELTVEGVDRGCKDFPKSGFYKEGTVFTFKTRIICDADDYVFFNNKQVKASDYDQDYNIYTITMPKHNAKLVYTMDRFYLDLEYKVTDLFGVLNLFPIEADKVVEIQESYYISGIDPSIENPVVKVTTDYRDFEFNVAALYSEPIVKANYSGLSNDGTHIDTYIFKYVTDFSVDAHEFSISLVNGKYIEYYGRYFKFKNNRPFKIDYPLIAVDETTNEGETI